MRTASEITSVLQSQVGSGLRASGPAGVVRDTSLAARSDGAHMPAGAGEARNPEAAEYLRAEASVAGPGQPRACERRYPGRPEQVAQVRAFLAGVLAGCPAAADAILLANELASNAVRHSDSRLPRGEFRVRAEICAEQSVRVEVADAGGRWAGSGSESEPGCEEWPGGRGLLIVEAIASSWGVTGDETGRTVWFVIGWNAG
jgi:serine/threonine-protein kinase RsbW